MYISERIVEDFRHNSIRSGIILMNYRILNSMHRHHTKYKKVKKFLIYILFFLRTGKGAVEFALPNFL